MLENAYDVNEQREVTQYCEKLDCYLPCKLRVKEGSIKMEIKLTKMISP